MGILERNADGSYHYVRGRVQWADAALDMIEVERAAEVEVIPADQLREAVEIERAALAVVTAWLSGPPLGKGELGFALHRLNDVLVLKHLKVS